MANKSKKALINLAGAWKNNPGLVNTMRKVYKERKKFRLREIN